MRRLSAILVLLALLCGAGYWQYARSLSAVDAGSERRTTVKIAPGTSVTGIAELLHEKGVLRSPSAFRVYVRIHGMQGNLQAGAFVLRPSQSVPEIVAILTTGKAEEAIITIPEGWTIRELDALLAEKGFIEEGDFEECARTCDVSGFAFLPPSAGLAPRGGRVEGYLFPDTYYVEAAGFSSEALLHRLLSTFERKVTEPLAVQVERSGRTLQEIVTMASLVEEESRHDEERAVVAGILWKRADAGMGLGVDATVRYIVEKPTGAITTTDLNVNSPYNTRKYRGLPPGPIASPGLASIQATLKPQETEYWYYLHAPSGQIHYAVTNEEHNINRFRYLRGGE